MLHALESRADLVVVCLSPGRLCDCAEVKPISTRLQDFSADSQLFHSHHICAHVIPLFRPKITREGKGLFCVSKL